MTIHWYRTHAITMIQRIAGGAVAKAFARHANTSVTDRYTTASFEEVCAAVSMMTGVPHPLA